jgi:RNA polymerase sigma factor (sigma-70 family)
MKLTEVTLDIHQDLIEACKLGDRKSQYKLYRLYSKAMYNICYRMMNNREEAEDILQESFTDAFLKLETFRYESTFGAWLKSIVIHRCINQIKKRKPDLLHLDRFPERPEPENNIQYDDIQFRVRNIQHAMERLPEGYRMIFCLYLFEGYDHAEISEILGISESTSKSQFSRAKQKMKELLKMHQYEE